MNFLAPNGHAPLFEVDRKILGMKRCESFSGRMSAERGANPRKQFFDAKGLGDIIVSASVEGDDLVALRIANGEDNDRGVRGAPNFAASLDTAHAWKIDVQQNQIRLDLPHEF